MLEKARGAHERIELVSRPVAVATEADAVPHKAPRLVPPAKQPVAVAARTDAAPIAPAPTRRRSNKLLFSGLVVFMILFMITLGILSGVIEMQGKANANGATVERNIVALRLKYHTVQSNLLHLAMLLDLRLPTGNEQEFLGTGKASTKILGILSKKIGGGTTHLNIGYQRRDAELDSDELEVMLGFDQEVFKGFTLAGEFIGDFDLDVDDAISLFPGSIEMVDQPGDGSQSIRRIDLSNIPEQENDNTFDLALGVRIAATEQFSLLSSMLVPLNHGGLKPTVTATVEMSVFF